MRGPWWSVVALLVLMLAPGASRAESSVGSYAEAMSGCQAFQSAHDPGEYGYPGHSWKPCYAGPAYGGGYEVYADVEGASNHINGWQFPGTPPPSNPCTSLPSVSMFFDGKVLAGYSFTQNAKDTNGGTVQCAMTFTPTGAPVWNQWSGIWQTYGRVTPSGNMATGSGVTDGNGGQVQGVPLPDSYQNQPNPPAICDTASCYNVATDQYCASSGGSQYCVSGSTARSSPGGCNGSAVVLCGGSPSPPLPSTSQVPDPATQIVGQSNATQADPNTGATLPVVVNVYKGSQATGDVTNGQTGSDSGPAPASSSPSTGSASGGQDCNSPPICSGDAPTCAVVSQTWLSRCKPDWYDKNGDGTPDWVSNGLDSVGPSVPDTPVGSVVTTDTSGTSAIDESGWAGNTCPQLPSLTLFGKEMTYGDQSLFCSWLATLRPIFLLFCGFIAARILASGGKS